jgi:DNA-binding transcriptional LysR family regulator
MNEANLPLLLPYLRHFQAIAHHGNLRKAADALNLSPSAMTQSLKQLEEGLGVTLCIRSRKEFKLTPEGLQLVEATNLAFNELSRFTDSFKRRKKTGGHLCLGIIDGFSNSRYEDILAAITRQFQEAHLSIMVFPSEEIIRRLNSGELDGGFGIFSERSPHLIYKKIGEERLAYFISNRHKLYCEKAVTKDLVRGQKSVWIDNESKTKIEIERDIYQDHPSHSLKISAFTNNEGVAIQLLKTGKYIVPLPDTFASSSLSHGCKEIKISKGPRVLNQEFVYNPRLSGNILIDFTKEYFMNNK